MTVMPNQNIDVPARWKLIEATNGYDVDSGLYRELPPVSPGMPARSRSVRPAEALGRFLSALSAVHRRRREGDAAHAER